MHGATIKITYYRFNEMGMDKGFFHLKRGIYNEYRYLKMCVDFTDF
jgi:hypothetical protein